MARESHAVVSVIVAVYEEPTLLEALCECLALQDHSTSWEVIVCDDGSTSDISAVVKHAVAHFGINARYVWQPQRGFRAGLSRNNGIRQANGDLLVFLDGDMLVRPDFLAKHTELHDGSARIVCGTRRNVEAVTRDNLSSLLKVRPALPNLEAVRQIHWASHVPWMAMLGCNFSVPRRSEILFDEHLVGWGSDDRELAVRLVTRHGYTVVLGAEIEGMHAKHCSSATDANPINTRKHEDIVSFLRNKIYLRDKYPDIDLRPTLDLVTACYLDPKTDRWYIAQSDTTRSYAEVIRAARDWFHRNGIGLIAVDPAATGFPK